MHQLNDEQQKLAFEKHIFGSDWYSHIKIFWTKKQIINGLSKN